MRHTAPKSADNFFLFNFPVDCDAIMHVLKCFHNLDIFIQSPNLINCQMSMSQTAPGLACSCRRVQFGRGPGCLMSAKYCWN